MRNKRKREMYMFETCDCYKSKVLNEFCTALFCTSYRDYACPTENAKTDEIFEHDSFEEWFDMLIDTFLEEDLDFEVTKADIIYALSIEPNFIEDMKEEYDQLVDICTEIYNEEDED